MKLKYFIKARTAEMNKESRSLFYSIIRDVLGEIVATVKSTNNDGEPTNTKMFHKVVDGEHWYVIPLTKSPTDDQIDLVVDKLTNNLHMGDFTIETSLVENQDLFDNNISKDDYSLIAEKFAQKTHEDWLAERTANGWRYGEQRNDEHKTHPLIKNWSQLSDRDRNINPKLINEFVNILKSNGFKISKK